MSKLNERLNRLGLAVREDREVMLQKRKILWQKIQDEMPEIADMVKTLKDEGFDPKIVELENNGERLI